MIDIQTYPYINQEKECVSIDILIKNQTQDKVTLVANTSDVISVSIRDSEDLSYFPGGMHLQASHYIDISGGKSYYTRQDIPTPENIKEDYADMDFWDNVKVITDPKRIEETDLDDKVFEPTVFPDLDRNLELTVSTKANGEVIKEQTEFNPESLPEVNPGTLIPDISLDEEASISCGAPIGSL